MSRRRFPTDKELEARLLPFRQGSQNFFSFEDTERKFSEVMSQPVHSLDICPADTPPPTSQAAFDDVFADLIKSHGAVLKLHPTLRRWTVFLRQADGEYAPTIVICEQWKNDDPLPKDLENSLDPRLHIIVKGCVGEYKVPTRQDFEHLRYTMADVQYLGGHRKAAARHRDADLARQRSKARDRNRWIRGFVNYYAQQITQEVNRRDGAMQGLPFLPQTSTEFLEKEFPAYEEIDALHPDTGAPLGFKHRRKLADIERALRPEAKRLVALAAAQKRWKSEHDAATPSVRKLLYLCEPCISDTERSARIMAFAEVQDAERADLSSVDALAMIKEVADSEANKRINDSETLIDELQARAREENRNEWLSRVQPQSLSRS
jgi:hypothetical protein